ncbi:MAG: STAS domain-containing protein [Acidimicrobiales bacterium]
MAPSEEFPTPESRGRAAERPGTVVLVIEQPITRRGIAALCERGRTWLEQSGATVIVCDVGAIPDPDGVTLEALTRVALTVRRAGRQIRLRHASRRLQDLLSLVGLREVLPLEASGVELEGQAEEREHALRIEEVMEPGDPPA